MTGWNMPPGCNVSDIPGNRPEDQAEEALFDELMNAFAHIGIDVGDEDKLNTFAEWFSKQMGQVYHQGYKQGMADEAMARELQLVDIRKALRELSTHVVDYGSIKMGTEHSAKLIEVTRKVGVWRR